MTAVAVRCLSAYGRAGTRPPSAAQQRRLDLRGGLGGCLAAQLTRTCWIRRNGTSGEPLTETACPKPQQPPKNERHEWNVAASSSRASASRGSLPQSARGEGHRARLRALLVSTWTGKGRTGLAGGVARSLRPRLAPPETGSPPGQPASALPAETDVVSFCGRDSCGCRTPSSLTLSSGNDTSFEAFPTPQLGGSLALAPFLPGTPTDSPPPTGLREPPLYQRQAARRGCPGEASRHLSLEGT